MAQSVRDVMTADPVTMQSDSPITEAARAMRESDIGDVIVLDDGKVCGIVTDRDIVVRAIAEGKDPSSTRLSEICSQNVTTIEPDSRVGEAVKLMEQKAIRRLPVVENGKAVGIVTLGDLAVERDSKSALAQISDAPPNN